MANDAAGAVETVVVPRSSDLGDGFHVRRALPSAARRMVGPFVFLDEFGPTLFEAGRGLDVRPHPHIGLATVTYLFEGELLHRDSLGSVQAIRPGELNWMTAGRGIVHSERSAASTRAHASRLAGVQAWVALPLADEDVAPSFVHHAHNALPVVDDAGARLRVIAGRIGGVESPAATSSALFYIDAVLAAGARVEVPREYVERAAYVVEGSVGVEGEAGSYEAGRMVVLRPAAAVTLRASVASRVLLLGGEPLDGERLVWWNFVASSRARIEAAKEAWRLRRFDAVPGETEFIPLPG